ncbi:hypothetical protein NON08_05180 [Cetobacterium somerae]|uniref:hypothetical protein n=1 Tax=Cetobacterium sp. NK01 TaxID=2993530 RepID=UPI0021168914|nr:hypothetical protein [Cetobacterium sp. NK01]MCQ8211920.1 hypothetical protein [Cetobacterium sp. NK01]
MILYFLIFKPLINLRKEIWLKDKLKIEIEVLKKSFLKKENELNNLKKEKEIFISENIVEDKNKLIFQSEYDVFKFIDQLSKDNNIDIQVIGRGIQKNDYIENKENLFFFHGIGKELSIYNFIFQIENEKKNISLNQENITIEIIGDVIELKSNIMYINNNKKEILDYDYYNNGMFRKSKSRDLKRKRRVI